MIVDSNIIIYAAQPDYPQLRRLIAEHSPSVSAMSVVEVLGYHRLTDADRLHFEAFFAAADVLPISHVTISQAVWLRQQKKMSLGDALIAATALTYGHTLATRNTKDFNWIAGLRLLDPFAS